MSIPTNQSNKETAMKTKIDKVIITYTDAEVLLSDVASSEGFNIPRVAINGFFHDGYGEVKITTCIEFQRTLKREWSTFEKPAYGWTDTKEPWSDCYGGTVKLSHKAGRIDIGDNPFWFCIEDKANIKMARKLAKTIAKYNLNHVEHCELKKVVLAIEKLNIPVKLSYKPFYGEKVSLQSVENNHANSRYDQEQQQIVNSELTSNDAHNN